jgi:hypothetical protein
MKQEEKQLGSTLEMGMEMLLSEQGYVPPVFVVDGYDSKGVGLSGVVQLQTKSDIRKEELLLHVATLAEENTALEPYLWKLKDVFIWRKRLLLW